MNAGRVAISLGKRVLTRQVSRLVEEATSADPVAAAAALRRITGIARGDAAVVGHFRPGLAAAMRQHRGDRLGREIEQMLDTLPQAVRPVVAGRPAVRPALARSKTTRPKGHKTSGKRRVYAKARVSPGNRFAEMSRVLVATRLRIGLTQEEVARQAGLPARVYRRMEGGKIGVTLRSLFSLLGFYSPRLTEVEQRTIFRLFLGPKGDHPWIDWERGILSVVVPEGVVLAEALERPLGVTLRRRFAKLEPRGIQAALRGLAQNKRGLRTKAIEEIFYGYTYQLDDPMITLLAQRARWDESFVWLITHREVPSFLTVVQKGTERRLCWSAEERFNYRLFYRRLTGREPPHGRRRKI